MQVYANEELNLEIFPLDINRWKDFETLFGDRGACGGCWYMSWRLKRSVFENQKGDGNKRAMRKLVEQNEKVGLLTYINNIPIGWCAVAPREDYLKLENSRIWKRIDNELVWSITCFFVAKPYRRKGLSLELLKGVIKYGEANKVIIIEGYPIVPYNEKIPAAFQCDRVIGSIALNNIVRGSFQSCHLGYKMDQININKGYMTEGLEKVIDYAFNVLKLHRIEANIMPHNSASLRVVEKLGFYHEGLAKKYLKINDRWEDHIHMVLLNESME